MKLSVNERLVILNVLPAHGNLTNLRLIREAREKLSFNEEEHKILKFREIGGGRSAFSNGVEPKEIDLGEVVTEILKSELIRLEKASQLSLDLLPIYEKFMY